ncbi:MAG: NAD-dependent epimerase/dehydratase family protein [Planctomycetaceae bacterium]|nr:NAD-dependent epimerase/dehydratase family protein [Planctomycetaceae bacterium]
MRKVLMLAGAGWLGHCIANKLSNYGEKVTVVHMSMDERFVRYMNADIAHRLGDTRDEAVCRLALKEVQPDVVINVHPDPNLIKQNYQIFGGHVLHYLHCSSAGVYVPTGKIPVSEDAPTYAIEKFGGAFIAKKHSDEQAMALHNLKHFPVTIIRPGVILGKGMIPLELWGLRNPTFFRQIRDGKVVQVSEQTDVAISATYVEDVAEIFAQAVLQPDKSRGQIFNAISWNATHESYLAAIGEALGVKPRVEYVPTKTIIDSHISDPAFSLPDYEFFMANLAVSGQKAVNVLKVQTESLVKIIRGSLDSL